MQLSYVCFMNEELTSAKKLDATLIVLRAHHYEVVRSTKTINEYMNVYQVAVKIMEINPNIQKSQWFVSGAEATLLLNHLVSDGYCASKGNTNTVLRSIGDLYIITFKGLVFSETGGYQAVQSRLDNEKRRVLINDRLIAWGAGAAILLFVLEIVKYNYPNSHNLGKAISFWLLRVFC